MQVIKTSGRQSMRITSDELINENSNSDFRERMLLNNSIDGLLKFDVIEVDGSKSYEYHVDDMESVERKCEKEKLKGKQVTNILNGILGILFRCSEYMLEESDFCLDSDSIYLDKQENVQLAYFPGYGKNVMLQLNLFSEFLMNRVDYNDDSAVVLTYSFYMRTKEVNCSIDELISLVREKSNGKENGQSGYMNKEGAPDYCIDARQEEVIEIKSTRQNEVYSDNYNKDVYNQNTRNQNEYIRGNYDRNNSTQNTTIQQNLYKSDKQSEEIPKKIYADVLKVLSGKQKAEVVLSVIIPICVFIACYYFGFFNDRSGKIELVKMCAALAIAVASIAYFASRILLPLLKKQEKIKQENNSADEATIMLSVVNVESGKLEPVAQCSFVSDDGPTINVTKFPYFVGCDEAHMDFVLKKIGVSRRHLKIDKSGGIVNIVDLNSTNGTFINGNKLKPQIPYDLKRGDKVLIGNCAYYLN